MEKLRHEKPTKKHENKAIEFIEEFHENNSVKNGSGGLQRYLNNYDEWLNKLENDENRIMSEEKVPAKTFFLVREKDNKIVGIIYIRLALNEKLKKYGGNIGYSIRPTERKKGYNKINLYLALLYCKENNVKEVFIDCDRTNHPSAKTIQALGGVLIREYYDSINAYCFVQNYIINVNKVVNEYRNVYSPYIEDTTK